MSRGLPITSRFEAAAMLARDVPVAEIARQLDVSPRTVYSWAKTSECQQHIASIKESVREATKHLAVADKVRRILQAQRMVEGIDAVISERAARGAISLRAMPGEATGHVAVKEIEIKGVITREAAFDAALHNERRKWLEYAARELGDLEAGVNVRHSGRVDHVVRRPNLGALSDAELEELAGLAEKVAAGEVGS